MAKKKNYIETAFYDSDGDLAPNHISKVEYRFDGRGNTILRDAWDDYNADGDWNARLRLEQSFDKKGNLKESTQIADWDGDEIIDSIFKLVNEYDRNGNLSKSTYHFDFNEQENSGRDSITVTDYNYDKHGNILSRIDSIDEGADRTIERSDSYTYQYDYRGRLVKEVANWFMDESQEYVITREYIDRNDSYIETYSEDRDADGDPDFTSTTTSILDKKGREVERTTTGDSENDGDIDSYVRFTNTYDRRDNLIKQVEEADGAGDGEIDSIRTFTYEFDKKGELIKYTDFRDSLSPEYGSDQVFITQYERDKHGNVLVEKSKADSDGDGVFEAEDIRTYTYDKHGYVLRENVDYFGDGIIEEIRTFDYDAALFV